MEMISSPNAVQSIMYETQISPTIQPHNQRAKNKRSCVPTISALIAATPPSDQPASQIGPISKRNQFFGVLNRMVMALGSLVMFTNHKKA